MTSRSIPSLNLLTNDAFFRSNKRKEDKTWDENSFEVPLFTIEYNREIVLTTNTSDNREGTSWIKIDYPP